MYTPTIETPLLNTNVATTHSYTATTSTTATATTATNATIPNFTADEIVAETANIPDDATIQNITVNGVNAQHLTTTNATEPTVVATSMNVSHLTADTINSIHYNSTSIQTVDFEASYPKTGPQPNNVLQFGKLQNGQVDNASNYNYINNTTTTFSDFQLLNGAAGNNRFYMYGTVIDGSTSLPGVVTYNSQLDGLDVDTGFGGVEAYLSWTNNASSTLRYETDGNLSLYSDPNTLIWQTPSHVSDIRLKTNIWPLYDAGARVRALQGVYFDYKHAPGRRHAGFIAQDVEPVLPECILRPATPDAFLSIQYETVIPFLVESLKELINEHRESKDQQCGGI
jgi:hypothetical protein